MFGIIIGAGHGKVKKLSVMFGIKEGERLKLYKHTNGTCNASGPAIRALRERAGISQEQLAAKLQLAGLNLNQKAVSRIETGDRVVPDFELNYFATVLGVPVCTLLEYETTSSPYSFLPTSFKPKL